MQKVSTFFLSFLLVGHLIAQDTRSTAPYQKPYHFQAGISYLTNYVYGGRSDSLPYPYIIPTIAFQHKSGISVDANLYYLIGKNAGGFDFLDINASYEFDIRENLSGAIYATKYFYSSDPHVITGNISSMLGANLSYDLGGFVSSLEGYGMFGGIRPDIWLTPSIERQFQFGTGSKWSITPNFNLNFSSLNFYEGYATRRAKQKQIIGKRPTPGSVTVEDFVTVSDTKLKLLDYELTTPITYEHKMFSINFAPTVALPINPIYTTTRTTRILANGTKLPDTIQDSTPYSEKNLKMVFFAQFSFLVKF